VGKHGAGKIIETEQRNKYSGSDRKKVMKKENSREFISNSYSKSKYVSTQRNSGSRSQNINSVDRNDFDYRDFEYGDKNQIPQKSNDSNILCGRNPIREALRSGRDLEKLLVQKGELSSTALEIVRTARENKVFVQEVDKRHLDAIALNHQGLIAYASAYKYFTVDEILEEAKERNESPFIVILDGITDPHNLGAIIRTAECTGVHGVILPQHRSVGLTPSAVKSSAGAIEHIKVARVTNLNRVIEDLKRKGIWTYAMTMSGQDFEAFDYQDGTAIVVGSEGDGLSRLTEEKCDITVSLPMKGVLDSLNASVAAGVMMYKVFCSRRLK